MSLHMPCCAFCWTLQRGHSGSLLGIKWCWRCEGVGTQCYLQGQIPLNPVLRPDIRQQPIWSFWHLCSGHRFNPHNLTKSLGILTKHGLPKYLLCVLCTFFFIALSLWEIRKILFWKPAAVASENIAETAGAQRERFAALGTAPGCWGWEEQEGIFSRRGGEEGKAEASVLKDTVFAERGVAGKKQQKELWTRERKAGKGNSRNYFPLLPCFQ